MELVAVVGMVVVAEAEEAEEGAVVPVDVSWEGSEQVCTAEGCLGLVAGEGCFTSSSPLPPPAVRPSTGIVRGSTMANSGQMWPIVDDIERALLQPGGPSVGIPFLLSAPSRQRRRIRIRGGGDTGGWWVDGRG